MPSRNALLCRHYNRSTGCLDVKIHLLTTQAFCNQVNLGRLRQQGNSVSLKKQAQDLLVRVVQRLENDGSGKFATPINPDK